MAEASEVNVEMKPNAPQPIETPADFLAALTKALGDSEGVDTDLAVILRDHLLTITPQANAVASAKVAITQLAAKRASSEEAAVANG